MEAGVPNPLVNRKGLQVSLEILVRIPQLDIYGLIASPGPLSNKLIT